MRKQRYFLMIAVCLGAGCSAETADLGQSNPAAEASVAAGPSDPLATETDIELARLRSAAAAASSKRFPWDKEPRPYKVIEYSQDINPAEGLQHRTVRAILPAPETRATAEAGVREIYETLAADIDSAQADASSKRINILLFDSLADARTDDGSQIVQASFEAGATVPAWDEADVLWKWRDPQHRPPAGQLALFHEYWSEIDQCTRRAEEPFHNARGEFIGKPEDQAEIDWRFAEERRELIDTLLERYSLSADELATQIARVSLWRQGIIPTEDDVARTAKSYLERWADE